MSVGCGREADRLMARGWRVFDFGDERRVVVWDPDAAFLAAVPRELVGAITALAEEAASLRSALTGRAV